MGWLYDLVKDLPSSPALKERIALAEDKYARAVEDLEQCKKENEALLQRIAELQIEAAELRARIPAEPRDDLGEDTRDVLLFLFHGDDRVATETLAKLLGQPRNVAMYHVDVLRERGLAIQTGVDFNDDYCWGLTAEGRRYVVENRLHA